MDHGLIIFIRNPEQGKVKTRLAKDLGDQKALQIYEQLLDHTRRIARSVPAKRYLFYSNFIDRKDPWPESDFEKHRQPPGDLGDRMLRAFDLALAQVSKAVIIGSDCPGLSTEILQTAFEKLDTHDFVIGPALDGGYYLLGMKQLAPRLFLEMTWSTDQVFRETTRRMERSAAGYYCLPKLPDIDYAEDWERYRHLLEEK